MAASEGTEHSVNMSRRQLRQQGEILSGTSRQQQTGKGLRILPRRTDGRYGTDGRGGFKMHLAKYIKLVEWNTPNVTEPSSTGRRWKNCQDSSLDFNLPERPLVRGEQYILMITGSASGPVLRFNEDSTASYSYDSLDYTSTHNGQLDWGRSSVCARLTPKNMPRALDTTPFDTYHVGIRVGDNNHVLVNSLLMRPDGKKYSTYSTWGNVCDDIHTLTLDFASQSSDIKVELSKVVYE